MSTDQSTNSPLWPFELAIGVPLEAQQHGRTNISSTTGSSGISLGPAALDPIIAGASSAANLTSESFPPHPTIQESSQPVVSHQSISALAGPSGSTTRLGEGLGEHPSGIPAHWVDSQSSAFNTATTSSSINQQNWPHQRQQQSPAHSISPSLKRKSTLHPHHSEHRDLEHSPFQGHLQQRQFQRSGQAGRQQKPKTPTGIALRRTSDSGAFSQPDRRHSLPVPARTGQEHSVDVWEGSSRSPFPPIHPSSQQHHTPLDFASRSSAATATAVVATSSPSTINHTFGMSPPDFFTHPLPSSTFYEGHAPVPLPPPNPPSDIELQTSTETQKRAVAACRFCRARKLRCDGNQPCRQCERRSIDCSYPPPPQLKKRKKEEGGPPPPSPSSSPKGGRPKSGRGGGAAGRLQQSNTRHSDDSTSSQRNDTQRPEPSSSRQHLFQPLSSEHLSNESVDMHDYMPLQLDSNDFNQRWCDEGEVTTANLSFDQGRTKFARDVSWQDRNQYTSDLYSTSTLDAITNSSNTSLECLSSSVNFDRLSSSVLSSRVDLSREQSYAHVLAPVALQGIGRELVEGNLANNGGHTERIALGDGLIGEDKDMTRIRQQRRQEFKDRMDTDKHGLGYTTVNRSTQRYSKQSGKKAERWPLAAQSYTNPLQTTPLFSIPGMNAASEGWWDELLSFFGPNRALSTRIVDKLLRQFVARNPIFFGLLHTPTLLDRLRKPETRKHANPALYFSVVSVATCDVFSNHPEPWTAELEAADEATKQLAIRISKAGHTHLEGSLMSAERPSIETGQAASILAMMEAEASTKQIELICKLESIVETLDMAETVSMSLDAPNAMPIPPSSPAYYARPSRMPSIEAEINAESVLRLCWSSCSHWSLMTIKKPDLDFAPGLPLFTKLRPMAVWEPSNLPDILPSEFYCSNDFMRAGAELARLQHRISSLPRLQTEPTSQRPGLQTLETLVRLEGLEEPFMRYVASVEAGAESDLLRSGVEMLGRCLVAARASLWRKTRVWCIDKHGHQQGGPKGHFSKNSSLPNLADLPSSVQWWLDVFLASAAGVEAENERMVSLIPNPSVISSVMNGLGGERSNITPSQLDSLFHHVCLALQIMSASGHVERMAQPIGRVMSAIESHISLLGRIGSLNFSNDLISRVALLRLQVEDSLTQQSCFPLRPPMGEVCPPVTASWTPSVGGFPQNLDDLLELPAISKDYNEPLLFPFETTDTIFHF